MSVCASGLLGVESGGHPGLSSWILHSAALISLKLISSLYTIRPQVINHRRWEQSPPNPQHFKKFSLAFFFFFFCDRASKVARLLFMVNSVWSISHVLMWRTRDHCSRTHWTCFFKCCLLTEWSQLMTLFALSCSDQSKKKKKVLTSMIFVKRKFEFFTKLLSSF